MLISWHEHDPLEIVQSVEQCIDGAIKVFEKQGHSVDSIKAVGIANQRETTVVWDKETGEPLYNAIVWTDTRTQALVRKLKARLGSGQLQDLCGLPLSTYPSVGKLLWLLENEAKVSEAYERGILCFGTIDSWLVYRLNGGPKKNVFVSDSTNASRTMFMNIHTLEYDDSLIDFFRLDPSKLNLPRIIKSSHAKDYGSIATARSRACRQQAVLETNLPPWWAKRPSLPEWPRTLMGLVVSCSTILATGLSYPCMDFLPLWHMTLKADRRFMPWKGVSQWPDRV